MTTFIATAIPYVNAAPHVGHALELVQADVLARHRRLRGEEVYLLTGTDDNALKNVTSAREAGAQVQSFVDENAALFESLAATLSLSHSSFVRTSSPLHHRGVTRLWERSRAQGDFYQQSYTGLYCAGCEQFYAPQELPDGVCPEHQRPVEEVSEVNWFFALSRYKTAIRALLESGEVEILPLSRRREVLSSLEDIPDVSVSRPSSRSGGWGVPVPGDPSQVVYVWWDALANYVTALGYGESPEYERWWASSQERIHVVGKGITRFHAVYWLALLLSAGEPLPTKILVHEYLTVGGEKISKSLGNAVSPLALADHSSDALRWWLAADVSPRGDSDFTEARLKERFNQDLANTLGNLVNRTLVLLHRHCAGSVLPLSSSSLLAEAEALPGEIDAALAAFDLQAATRALLFVARSANRFVDEERPWDLAKDPSQHSRLHEVLSTLVHVERLLARELSPFVPSGAEKLLSQLGQGDSTLPPSPVFPRL